MNSFDLGLEAFEHVRQVPERFIDCWDQVLVLVRTEARMPPGSRNRGCRLSTPAAEDAGE